MIDISQMTRASMARLLALTVVAMLVAASTVIPSLSYAQKYADHLSQYGGYDARVAALSGFSSLYVNPQAPMLPIVLAIPSDEDVATILPTPCAVDKTVLPRVVDHTMPAADVIAYTDVLTLPLGMSPPALRGPPRQNA